MTTHNRHRKWSVVFFYCIEMMKYKIWRKIKTNFLPNILWIGLSIVILIALTLLVVLPIVILANKGNYMCNHISKCYLWFYFVEVMIWQQVCRKTFDLFSCDAFYFDSNWTAKSTICPTTSITTTVTIRSLPSQCSSYTTINDDNTRSPDYTATVSCDDVTFPAPTWTRFTGSGGTLLANCPIEDFRCGAAVTGWYTGIYPSMAGDTTSGTVCFSYNSDYCAMTSIALVTNCNGFYVYYLRAPDYCDLRYCTI